MQVTITCPISFIRLSIYLLSSLGLGFHIYLNTQEKAFPTPARTKSYQPPSPPVPKVVPLVRSASEDQVVLKQEEVGEVVKDEMPWTEAMVQDMFDCLDQVRQQYDNHCLCKKTTRMLDQWKGHLLFQAREELDSTASVEVNPR